MTNANSDCGRDDGLQRVIERVSDEQAIVRELLALDGCRILELGCGRAQHTRAIALGGAGRDVLALEVDEIQHRQNLEIADLPNVRFALGAAESIPAPDDSFDVVFLFKSLHHVPVPVMDRAMVEIARVLGPGGFAYISEPLYRDDYNDLLRIFHDERDVRQQASEAVDRALQSGLLELVSQTFFRAPLHFANLAEFERRVVAATHSDHRLDAAQQAAVRAQFERSAGGLGENDGVTFAQPIRVDLLRG
ncbi:MAG: class I SAM-dependent methyltransferase [Planctomycetota bacterium]